MQVHCPGCTIIFVEVCRFLNMFVGGFLFPNNGVVSFGFSNKFIPNNHYTTEMLPRLLVASVLLVLLTGQPNNIMSAAASLDTAWLPAIPSSKWSWHPTTATDSVRLPGFYECPSSGGEAMYVFLCIHALSRVYVPFRTCPFFAAYIAHRVEPRCTSAQHVFYYHHVQVCGAHGCGGFSVMRQSSTFGCRAQLERVGLAEEGLG